jgi:hypothetical protein
MVRPASKRGRKGIHLQFQLISHQALADTRGTATRNDDSRSVFGALTQLFGLFAGLAVLLYINLGRNVEDTRVGQHRVASDHSRAERSERDKRNPAGVALP